MSEYVFIRFFQRPPNELTNDERYWPVDKFNELTIKIKQLLYLSTLKATPVDSSSGSNKNFDVFISYQWDKKKDIINLYNLFTNMGLKVWLDIHQMVGGDSLYDKIDNGLRNSDIVISCVTTKYGLSANCRKEVALADYLSKPIIPILLEKEMKYPPSGPMAPTLSILKYIDFTHNIDEKNSSISWSGKPFDDLLQRMKPHLSKPIVEKVTSKACIISYLYKFFLINLFSLFLLVSVFLIYLFIYFARILSTGDISLFKYNINSLNINSINITG
jgi:hypothetical protein